MFEKSLLAQNIQYLASKAGKKIGELEKSAGVSALTGEGLDDLRAAVREFAAAWRERHPAEPRELEPWEKAKLEAEARRAGKPGS